MSQGLHGQWIGRYDGSNKGLVMVDIDLRGECLSGSGILFDDAGLPGSFVTFETKDRSDDQFFKELPVSPIDPKTADIVPNEHIKHAYAEAGISLEFPSKADVRMRLSGDFLHLDWTTEIGTAGSAKLPRSRSHLPSEVQSNQSVQSWSDFKSLVSSWSHGRFIFRGQPAPWRLRTAFHRTVRKDVFRFMRDDIPKLHQRLSGLTSHLFDLSDNVQNGAFWNLVQHHGYPTPLLDWSYSPFVAAFFAYRNKFHDDEHAPNVRIYAFDKHQWCEDFLQLVKIAPVMPHFSILECLALENPRLIPQQALSSVTNVDDIEGYIREHEQAKGKSYLTAYDLPAADASSVLSELRLMGITAGALFPGLDGACEELKYRNFGFS